MRERRHVIEDLSGKVLWPGWRTVRLIGCGSFGAVYEIERNIFDEIEKAALKVITIPQSSGDIQEMKSDGYDDESITRIFKSHLKNIVAEYSLMHKLNGSANVVNCDDVRYIQHDDGIGWDIFIKMELLTPLTDVLPEQIPESQALRIGRDLCRALSACRQFGIVHRDIKPQNIFISPLGDYKLGDFGIAKTVEKASGGTKIGTYKYMAPEVYNNQPYGAGADIYSLGMVLYWLLNERRMPFLPLPPETPRIGMEEEARLRRFRGEPIHAPKHGSDALKRIVLKACAYDPHDRYQSADDMLQALEALHSASGEPTAPASLPEAAIAEDEGTVGAFFNWMDTPAPVPAPAPEPVAPPATGANDEGTVGIFRQITSQKSNESTSVPTSSPDVNSDREAGDLSAPGRIKKPRKRKWAFGLLAGLALVIALVAFLASGNAKPTFPTNLKAGDVITFGSYEQDGNTWNGVEPIEWIVVEVRNETVLLLSKYCLAAKPYNEVRKQAEWADCTLRSWLNQDFYNAAFSSGEKRVITTTLLSGKTDKYDSAASASTQDHIFLLSRDELVHYFHLPENNGGTNTSYSALVCHATASVLQELNKTSAYQPMWWERSKTDSYLKAYYCNYNGRTHTFSALVDTSLGVRPALWIDLS